VNGRITGLFRVLAVGLVALIAACSYWQVWAAPSLEARRDNPRLVYKELSIKRGEILAADGTVLATNRPRRVNGRTLYYRRYPLGGVTAHAVGYSSIEASRTGIEQSWNDYLTGANTDLSGGLARLTSSLTGSVVQGNDVVLSLDIRGQKAAYAALRASGHRGAVVALEPSTGRVLVLASYPSFNPNGVDRDFTAVQAAPGAPLLDRVTQGLYPPGSTFKVVTASAALDSGVYTPQSMFKGGRCINVTGPPLCNAAGELAPDPNSLELALVHSYNTTFAQVGEGIGRSTLERYMQLLGFWQSPPIDLPTDEVVPSGTYRRPGVVSRPGRPMDVARVAIGQANLLATPLQMAMVTAAVADGGQVMRPHLVDRVRAPDGHTVTRVTPESLGSAFTATTAATLTGIMQRVVDEGTGQAAQIGGLAVAGKTGTAQTGRRDAAGQPLNDAWFVAFAPVVSPRIAIAVVVEDTPRYGGEVAAPIVRRVLEALR
jgi:peptidoglycan glycosyltransferase